MRSIEAVTLSNLERTINENEAEFDGLFPAWFIREALACNGVVACGRGVCSKRYRHAGECVA